MGFFDGHPLESEGTMVSRLCVQLVLIWLLPRVIHTALLEPLLQPRVISEIISGILLGPSCLGQIHGFTDYLFPKRSIPFLQSLGAFGVILFLFMTGCHLKPEQLWQCKWKAMFSSFTAVGLTLAVAPGLTQLFNSPDYTSFNDDQLVLLMAIILSIPAEAVMARILGERGLLGSKLGSLSLATDSIGLVICFLLLAALLSLYGAEHPCQTPTNLCPGTVYVCPNDAVSTMDPMWIFLLFVGFVVVLLPLCRLLFTIIAARVEQKQRTEGFLFLCALTINFACAWFTQTLGLSSLIGPVMLGLIGVPRRGPLAHDLEATLGPITTTLLLPIFFALVGLRTDFNLLTSTDVGLAFVLLGVLWGTTFVGAFVVATVFSRGLTWHNFYFGSLLTCKGLTALTIFNILDAVGVITARFYALVVLYAVVSCAIVSPLIFFCQIVERRQTARRHQADPERGAELNVLALPRVGYLAPVCSTVAAWVVAHHRQPDPHVLFARLLDDFDSIEQYIPLLQKPVPTSVLVGDDVFGPAYLRWIGIKPNAEPLYRAFVAPNILQTFAKLCAGDKATGYHPYTNLIIGYDQTDASWDIVQYALQCTHARVFIVTGEPGLALSGAPHGLALTGDADSLLVSVFQDQGTSMSLTFWQPNEPSADQPPELAGCKTPVDVLRAIATAKHAGEGVTAVFCPIPNSRSALREQLNIACHCHVTVIFESTRRLGGQFAASTANLSRRTLPSAADLHRVEVPPDSDSDDQVVAI